MKIGQSRELAALRVFWQVPPEMIELVRNAKAKNHERASENKLATRRGVWISKDRCGASRKHKDKQHRGHSDNPADDRGLLYVNRQYNDWPQDRAEQENDLE
jgi:hypothetical protein